LLWQLAPHFLREKLTFAFATAYLEPPELCVTASLFSTPISSNRSTVYLGSYSSKGPSVFRARKDLTFGADIGQRYPVA
jgi:hypothetical protein